MRKLTKFGCVLVAGICAVTAAFALVGCSGKKAPDNEHTLEILASNSGYDVKFIQSALDAFKEEEWVKAKYPDLQTVLKTDLQGNVLSKLEAARGLTADLVYTSLGVGNMYNKEYGNDGYYFEDLNDVYNGYIPVAYDSVAQKYGYEAADGSVVYDTADAITYRDKMSTGLDEEYLQYPTRGPKAYPEYEEDVFFSAPAFRGTYGFYVNEDYLDLNLGEGKWKLPTTTNEFIDMCSAIKLGNAVKTILISGNPDPNGKLLKSPFVMADEAYWQYVVPFWLAQYYGLGEFENFMKISDGGAAKTGKNFKQYGYFEAIYAVEQLIVGNVEETAMSQKIGDAQNHFYQRYGAFMFNGDWFETEMIKGGKTLKDNIKLMQIPVISAIVDNCSANAFTYRYSEPGIYPAKMYLEGYEEIVPGEGKKAQNEGTTSPDQTSKLDADAVALADKQLSYVINAIDAGKDDATIKSEYAAITQTSDYGGVEKTLTDADLTLLRNARSYQPRVIGENFVIPSWANGKEVAKDFLRFLASDAGVKITMEKARTLSPFAVSDANAQYINSKTTKDYATLQGRIATANKMVSVPTWEKFKLFNLKNLKHVATQEMLEVNFTQQQPETAYTIWTREIRNGTQTKWNDFFNA